MNVRTLHPGFVTALWVLPIAAFLQAILGRFFLIGGVYPALVLMVVVNWGILRGMDEGVLWGFIGGLLVDLFSGWHFGTATVALVIVAAAVSLGQGTLIRTHTLIPLATMFGSTILYYLVILFVFESLHPPVDWVSALRSVALPAALYNAVLNIPGFWLTQRLERRVYPVPRANW